MDLKRMGCIACLQILWQMYMLNGSYMCMSVAVWYIFAVPCGYDAWNSKWLQNPCLNTGIATKWQGGMNVGHPIPGSSKWSGMKMPT